MTIGIIREGKNPPDKRVALTPDQCKNLLSGNRHLSIKVQPSPIRCFPDREYQRDGIEVTEDVSSCEILMGVKEVPVEMLMEGKTYLFFSHTIKKQPHNRKLLQAVLAKNIRLIDYETLTYPEGNRVIGFGHYAGLVGAYNGLMAYGQRTGRFSLKPAHECHDLAEMRHQMQEYVVWQKERMVVTGGGRVASGANKIMMLAGADKVSVADFLSKRFDGPVYCNPDVEDYYTRDGRPMGSRREFYADPTAFRSTFDRFLKSTDILFTCHFWDGRSQPFFTKDMVNSPDFGPKVIADITCDIDGSIPTTTRSTTIEEPLYGYHRASGNECAPFDPEGITVMAVDNLPCELPRDASIGFGEMLMRDVIPLLLNDDQQEILKRATIAEGGRLTEKFSYLSDYVR
jgi:alanine dehydrogenase